MRKKRPADVEAVERIVRAMDRKTQEIRDLIMGADGFLSQELKALYDLGNGDLGKGLSRLLEMQEEQFEQFLRENPEMAVMRELQRSENPVEKLRQLDPNNPVHRAFWRMLEEGLMFIGTSEASQELKKIREEELSKAALQFLPAEPPAVPMWRPWEHVEDATDRERLIIQLWCEGRSAEEIGDHVFLSKKVVWNILSDLRKRYPDARIPTGHERRKLMRF